MKLYDAHPAFLLRRASAEEGPHAYGTDRLGLAWLGLEAEESARRTRAFRASLLAYFAENDGARFRVWLVDAVDAARVAAELRATRNGCIVEGSMSTRAAGELASEYFFELVVFLPSGDRLRVSEGWQSAGVWISDPTRLRLVLARAVTPVEKPASRPLIASIKWLGYQAQWFIVVVVALAIGMWLLPSLGVPRGLAAIPTLVMIPAVILVIGAWEQRRTLSRERSAATTQVHQR